MTSYQGVWVPDSRAAVIKHIQNVIYHLCYITFVLFILVLQKFFMHIQKVMYCKF